MYNFTILSEDQWYDIPKEKENNFRMLIGEKRKGRVMNTGYFVNDFDEIRLVGKFLKINTPAFYHSDYNSGGAWELQGTIENMIWTLKNDVDPFPDRLKDAVIQLVGILEKDLHQIIEKLEKNNLTICVVPRAKADSFYLPDQLFFREAISYFANKFPNIENGTKFILRHTNTRTTHLNRNGEGGDGDLPYPWITKDTCTISNQVKGKNILLIDDLYTKSVNIDEDAIQALIDNGANSVTFYSIGKTIFRNH